ncbi:MAG: M48 family metalloprotease [Actinomycetota bacterium]|nr:M48 family metalloprotease [Actinomycetota bacterium]
MYRADPRSPATATGLVVAVPVTVLLSTSGLQIGVSLLIGAVVALLIVGPVARRASSRVRAWIGGRAATTEEFPRLHNTVNGLCLVHGLDPPDLYVLDSETGNAAVLGDRHAAALIVTTGALDSLDLVGLEALVAHAVARCRDGDLADETAAALFGRVPVIGQLARRLGDRDRAMAADLAGARLIRYPPGMQRALATLSSLGTTIDCAPTSTAHLWLLRPDGGEATATHPPVAERVAALREL